MNSVDVYAVRKLFCPWETLNAFLEAGLECLTRFLCKNKKRKDSCETWMQTRTSCTLWDGSALESIWKLQSYVCEQPIYNPGK